MYFKIIYLMTSIICSDFEKNICKDSDKFYFFVNYDNITI